MSTTMAPTLSSETIERPSFSSKSSSISAPATLRNGGNRLMSKFFGNRLSPAKETLSEGISPDHTPRQLQPEIFPPGLLQPCPFIRPLEHKLQARSELRGPMGPMPRLSQKARSFDTLSTCTSSAFHVAVNREKTHRILDNRSFNNTSPIHHEGMADLPITTSFADLRVTEYEETAEYDMDAQIYHQLEQVAKDAAEDPKITLHWDYYIQCYSKGQFNLNDPPEPPPRNPKFEYLPAIFPHQEELRLYASQSYDIVWSNWSQEKASALLSAAMKEFDTGFASISFFDGKKEYFKMEHGYNASQVSRAVSIAAHALLSADVLVVLDTKQDWRFEGNPLVWNDPKIRFFAGAPMLSPDGHPVGVFAVFSKEPRHSFNVARRRELAAYGALVLKDITQQAIWLSDTELQSPRSTPLLQRDSDHRPSKRKPPKLDIDHALVPPGLRYQKTSTPPVETSRVFLTRQLSPSVLSEQTPPSSSEGSENDTFPGSPKGFGKNYKQLSVNSDLNHISASGDLITPDSEGFRPPTPRPFSASDLTSLNPHPPNTPEFSSQDHSFQNYSELTVENFMSLSDNDCAEQESPPLIDLSTPEERSPKLKSNAKQRIALPNSSRLTAASISSKHSSRSHRRSKSLKEQAAFECAAFAQKYGYDLVYVLEVRPARANMTDDQLEAPGGVRKKIMAAYGLRNPMPKLDTMLHVKVLRRRGWELYQNEDADFENGLYRVGCLVPLQTDNATPVSQRSSGVVFAAYRLPTLEQIGTPIQPPPEEETEEAMDTAFKIRHMLLGLPESHRLSRNFNSVPSSPKRQLNSQARELGKHILDETPEKYDSVETVEAERKPSNDDPFMPSNRYPAGEAVEVGHFLRDSVSDRFFASEAVEEAKPSLDATSTQSKRLTKSSKTSSGKTSKKDKPTIEVPMAAMNDRPFHSMTRFRPF